jgi:3-isopropylmalate dehydrogenase
MTSHILLLPGDGIGPEVVEAAVRVIDATGFQASYVTRKVGRSAIEACGEAQEPDVMELASSCAAVLLGAVGDDPRVPAPPGPRPEAALFTLRKTMDTFANLRPVRPHPALADRSPVRTEVLDGTDMLIVRELTGGIYYGARERTEDWASDTMRYTATEIERIVRLAFRLSMQRRRHVSSVDKANVLDTSRLWRDVVWEVAREFPDVRVEHLYVDNAAQQIVLRPASFDVIVTENMFGDILSDEAAVLAGSLGMLPSASVSSAPGGLFEPVHGTAHDIIGTGKANPVGAILSGAMMLRHAFGEDERAGSIERAVDAVISRGVRTGDLGGSADIESFTTAVIAALT